MRRRSVLFRAFLLVLCLLLTIPATVGCKKEEKVEGLRVVCTVFPLYDWARQIGGSAEIELILLSDQGTDLHSYQPTAEDMIQIATCDLLLMIGGQSDAWVEEALLAHPSEERRVCRISSLEGVTLRQVSNESLLCEEDCEDEHHSHGHDDGETDEHLWLSLKNAKVGCQAIADLFCELDGTNQTAYEDNLVRYAEALDVLDRAYADMVAAVTDPKVLFADRFPFLYTVEDYGIEYAAAFRGCTTETDADFETVIRLASRVDAWGLSCVLTTEHPIEGLASQICANTQSKNQKILAMNSLQSITKKELASGVTYLNTMEQNLSVLREALTN